MPVASKYSSNSVSSTLDIALNHPMIRTSGTIIDVSHLSSATIIGNHRPRPILIPPATLSECDINRVPPPLSGRGDRKGHLFPFSRSPSPRLRDCATRSSSGKFKTPPHSPDTDEFFGPPESFRSGSPASSTSASGRSLYRSSKMHNDSIPLGRYPKSPLSPKPTNTGLPPQNSPRRGNHGRQFSRNMQLNLGRYHPSNFPQSNGPSEGSYAMQGPQITHARAPPPMQIESPRLMREKHREFIEKARLSSKLAASPQSVKPEAPRLDPLGSPKGPVTPLALEEAGDYFSTVGGGKISPATSPGARSPRANSISSDEDTEPAKKTRKLAPPRPNLELGG